MPIPLGSAPPLRLHFCLHKHRVLQHTEAQTSTALLGEGCHAQEFGVCQPESTNKPHTTCITARGSQCDSSPELSG